MSAIDDLRTKFAAMLASIGNIRQDILDIKNSIPTSGGMTEAETQEVLQSVTALAEQLNALDLENPAPPTP